jgi:retinol dehydrogenase-13
MNKRGVKRYFKQYEVANIRSMIRNNRRDPDICTEDFPSRLVVISGATSGIGYHTARKYASHGARLLCINRNGEKSADLKAEIEKEFGVRCDYLLADLSDLKEARRVAGELAKMPEPIDVLIHNAGVYLTRRELTAEGFDKVLVVHHLAPFLINAVLREKLASQESAGSSWSVRKGTGSRPGDCGWTT